MIQIRCFTNLDDYQKEIWPEVCAVRPQIGDYVRSECNRELKIVRIIHQGGINFASLVIELTK